MVTKNIFLIFYTTSTLVITLCVLATWVDALWQLIFFQLIFLCLCAYPSVCVCVWVGSYFIDVAFDLPTAFSMLVCLSVCMCMCIWWRLSVCTMASVRLYVYVYVMMTPHTYIWRQMWRHIRHVTSHVTSSSPGFKVSSQTVSELILCTKSTRVVYIHYSVDFIDNTKCNKVSSQPFFFVYLRYRSFPNGD